MEMDLLGNAFSGLQVPKDSVTEIKEYISLKESNIILNSCESTQHRLLIGLAFKSGLRIQEISKIEVANIDLENKTIDVLRKGRRMRRLDIAAELINDLTIQVENCNALNHTFLFQGRRGIKPLTTKSIRDTFDGYLGKLDLNSDYVFHSLRKVYSTDLYYNENKTMHEISKLLDHSNTGITELYVLDKKYVEL
jgi:integrase/recombinase XerD